MTVNLKPLHVILLMLNCLVSEFEVGNLQPLDPVHGRLSPPGTSASQSTIPIHRHLFVIVGKVNIINTQRVPIFSPSDDRTSAFSQLLSLDMLPARGLPEVIFWQLFSKCGTCSNFMTTRTVPYHVCTTTTSGQSNLCFQSALIDLIKKGPFVPAKQPECQVIVSSVAVKDQYFLKFLDVHGLGGHGGVPEDVFKTIFYACRQCGRYMTARLMWNHHEDADFDDYRCINLADTSSSETMIARRKACAAHFPILEPLSQ